MAMKLSIIIPVLNEALHIVPLLRDLRACRNEDVEIIVVDGGSSDDTMALAWPHADRVIGAPQGRSTQMNAGAHAAQGGVLLFLHADTRLPSGVVELILRRIAQGKKVWGRFDVRIEGGNKMLPVIAFMMNWRSRLTGIATGDQALFVRRDVFFSAGGYPAQPLMEDIALSQTLKRYSSPICLHEKVATSGRRWESRGVWRTILLMWSLRLRYWLGESPEKLAKAYR